jgi:hypothetical protein
MTTVIEAAARTRTWLDANVDAGGQCSLFPDDALFYFKVPYLMVKAGLRDKAARVATRIRDRMIKADGDLAGSPAFDLASRVYGAGWVALAATMVERFDLARVVTQRLAAIQDAQSGGFVWPDAEAGAVAGDLQTAGGASMGLVAAGKLDNAVRLADRFAAHLELQPDPRRLSLFFRQDGSHVGPMPSGWLRAPYDVDSDQQLPAALAPLVIGLVWLARATGSSTYVETAKRYVEFVYSGPHNPAYFARSTKFGWAMLELYKDTGDQRLLQRAGELAGVLASWQSEDGLWDPRPVRGTPAPSERINYSADCAMTVLAVTQA